MLDEAQRAHGLTVLTRLAGREPQAENSLRSALESNLVELAEPAVEVAVETGDPMPRVLAELLAQHPDATNAARRLEHSVPPYTTGLLEVAVIVARRRLDGVANDQESRGIRASALVDYAERLIDAGRADEALRPAWSAVAQRRALASQGASGALELATALDVASRAEYVSGHLERSVKPAEEAVQLQLQLAQGRPSVPLAGDLLNLGNRLESVDRGREALAVYEQAATVFRALLAERPQSLRARLEDAAAGGGPVRIHFGTGQGLISQGDIVIDPLRADPETLRHGLAIALMNGVSLLHAADRGAEACTSAQEAVDVLRELAGARPDSYRLHFAVALSWQAAALILANRQAEALPVAEEAMDELHKLSAQHTAAAAPHLFLGVVILGNAFSGLGRWREALSVFQELFALVIPEGNGVMPMLADQFEELSARLAGSDDADGAVEASQSAVEACRVLCARGHEEGQVRLGSAAHNLGRRLAAAGRPQEAAEASAEAVRLLTPRFLDDSGADWRPMTTVLATYDRHAQAAGREMDVQLPLGAATAEVLQRFTEADQDFPREALALLAFGVSEAYRSTGHLDTAESVVDGLGRVAARDTDTETLPLAYAMASFNTIVSLVERGQLGRADRVLTPLALLARQLEHYPRVIEECGKSTWTVAWAHLEHGDLPGAKSVARAGEFALRSTVYLACRARELGEPSPVDFLAELDLLLTASE